MIISKNNPKNIIELIVNARPAFGLNRLYSEDAQYSKPDQFTFHKEFRERMADMTVFIDVYNDGTEENPKIRAYLGAVPVKVLEVETRLKNLIGTGINVQTRKTVNVALATALDFVFHSDKSCTNRYNLIPIKELEGEGIDIIHASAKYFLIEAAPYVHQNISEAGIEALKKAREQRADNEGPEESDRGPAQGTKTDPVTSYRPAVWTNGTLPVNGK